MHNINLFLHHSSGPPPDITEQCKVHTFNIIITTRLVNTVAIGLLDFRLKRLFAFPKLDSDTNMLSWTALDCGMEASSDGATDSVSPGGSEDSLRADRRSISCCSAGLLLLSAAMFDI